MTKQKKTGIDGPYKPVTKLSELVSALQELERTYGDLPIEITGMYGSSVDEARIGPFEPGPTAKSLFDKPGLRCLIMTQLCTG